MISFSPTTTYPPPPPAPLLPLLPPPPTSSHLLPPPPPLPTLLPLLPPPLPPPLSSFLPSLYTFPCASKVDIALLRLSLHQFEAPFEHSIMEVWLESSVGDILLQKRYIQMVLPQRMCFRMAFLSVPAVSTHAGSHAEDHSNSYIKTTMTQ